MKIKEIIKEIEAFAPLSLQDSYDNSGIQVGNVEQVLSGCLLCLDITEEVIEEALELECNLIISHHPLIFRALKSLTGKSYIERCIQKACKHDLVIYAAHTNLDNAYKGVSFRIAEKIGLQNIQILSPLSNNLLKLVTFVPTKSAEVLRKALFNAGAGQIGNYDSCSYNLQGEGTFRAGEGSKPFVGLQGELHFEQEERIEMALPSYLESKIVKTLLATHPYEEPAYDIYTLKNAWGRAGAGVIGELPLPETELAFLKRIKDVFKLKILKHSALRDKEVLKIAICGGSGAFLIPQAIANQADVFITGEAKYNDYFDVEQKLLLGIIGHYESEVCTKELIFEIITKKFPNFAVHFSNANINPVNYL
ncbi:GTP cyclohydrolase 1 type 2 [Bacteroidales bacterium]|nr:GTP cyclohydrolase 1 type 2 [Bacteroidales bacterium]